MRPAGAQAATPRKVWDRSAEDAYADPGEPVVRPGSRVLLQDGDSIYLAGTGSSPEGDRPFLDRLDLATLKTERLFHSDNNAYETVVGVLADNGTSVLTQRESKTEVPNYFVRTLPASGVVGPRALTAFTDPAPQLAGIQKQVIRYKRNDGLELSATIYTPAGYTPGKGAPLPTLLWAYPREFTSASAAAQVKGSPNRFTKVGGASHLLLLTQGYAIIDNPAIPIVGAGETANDTYVEQLVAGAQAAIDAAVALGVTDRDRVGVGRPQLRRVHDGQPAGALGPLPDGHRAQRGVQSDIDPVRLPGGNTHVLGGAADLREDVAVLVCPQDQRADPVDPRRGGR